MSDCQKLEIKKELTGDTRKIFVSNIKTVDESNSARILVGCKPIKKECRLALVLAYR